MTPARFRWGSLLILLGVLLLLRNMDVLNNNFWTDFAVYFPILLIAIGVEKIFTKSKLQFISYLTSVLLFAGGLVIAFNGSRGGESDNFFSESAYRQEAKPEIKAIHAVINLGHSNLTIRDATDDLVNGKFERFTAKPEINFRESDSDAFFTFNGRGQELFWGLVKIDGGDPNVWYLSFSNDVPLILECDGNNCDIRLNLATTPAQKITVNADQASIYLRLGSEQKDVNVDLTGKESDIRLRVPTTSALKVTGSNDAEYLSQVGLIREGDAFVNSGYDTLKNHIVVNLDDRLTSLSIDYY